mmetsp:Transcript_74707/g.169216  ORF Transcript_74707/g.169216 Transcript_74707/m.169216 type:complete len:294 (-) Transcript_74707:59-940(-)
MFVLLLCRLVLDVLGLCFLVHLGVRHELIVLFLRSRFRCLGLSLKACKVGLDDLQHAHDTTVLRLHALVRGVKDLRSLGLLLDEGGGLPRLAVEVLEDRQCLSDGSLGGLRVCHRLRVLGLLLLAELRRLGHGLVQLGDRLGQRCDVHCELRDGRLELIDVGVQGLHCLSLFFAGLLVCGELRVTPPLVLGLFVGLLHQTDQKILDHLPHLDERVISHARRKGSKHAARQLVRPGLQEEGSLLLLWAADLGTQAGKDRASLQQLRQVLLGCSGNSAARDDLDGLLDRLELLGA